MAFSKTAMQDTDQTRDIPLLQQWQNRAADGLKDVESVNVVWDVVQDPVEPYYVAIKREGLFPFGTSPPPTEIFGTYFWRGPSLNWIVTVGAFGVRVYDSVTGFLLFSPATVLFNDKQIGFTVYQYEDGTQLLIITDGTILATLDSLGVTTLIGDPDRPLNHVPYPVYLNGYLFLGDEKGNISNSKVNDPYTWEASNFITAEAYPDPILALARHGSYIVAFGQTSIQFFYDAANPTGTPLAVYSASTPQIGFRGGLAQHGDTLYFIGLPNRGNLSVYALTGFKAESLGSSALARRLDTFLTFPDFIRAGHILAINGHTLYTWCDRSTAGLQPLDSVFALDIDTKLWTKLEAFGLDTFPARSSILVENFSSTQTLVTFYGGTVFFRFLPITYRDNGIDFRVQFTTKNYDFGTRRTKFGARLLLSADQPATASNCQVSWSDDDYQTWSTPRNVNLANRYTQLYALGSFRKRAFRVSYTDNFPMRFTKMELDYSQGQA